MKMHNMNRLRRVALCLCLALPAPMLLAEVDDEEAAKLGNELTPLGAERAGNGKEGMFAIPEWTGGMDHLKAKPAKGSGFIDAFPDEQPLMTITAANYMEYAEYLSEGQKALFKAYPETYKMKVYPSHRTAIFPEWIYEETKKNATKVDLVDDGNGFEDAVKGYPFPIPKSGHEAMWNHMARYLTTGFRGYVNRAIVNPDGKYSMARGYFEIAFRYNHPDVNDDNFENKHLYALTTIVSPASQAGDSYLVHMPMNRVKDEVRVWIYNTGTRKVRRISEIGYDNPVSTLDGIITHDQIDMFNGPMDRYTFKLIGKKENLVSYNNYDFYDGARKYDELIKPNHPNMDLLRFEMHRVWVVQAILREGQGHIYTKRTFYIDEDSWLILLQDIYDERGEFWRAAESFAITLYEVPFAVNAAQAHYDLHSRRYALLNLTNEEKNRIEYDFFEKPEYFTTSRLKKFAEQRHR